MKLIQALPLALTLAFAACTSTSPGASRIASASPDPTPMATSVPTAAPTQTPVATASPTQTPVATASPVSTLDVPPDGALGYSDFADAGWLGSYCWHGLCADVIEIPRKSELPEIRVPMRESLIFSLEDGEFVRWIAQYGSDASPLATFGEGGEPADPDAATSRPDRMLEWVEFQAPPRGDWIVRVQIFFENGDASYYWHAVVE